MEINIGLIILALGLPVVIKLMKTAANERLCQDARSFSGTFAFFTAIGIMVAAIMCFIDKRTISAGELIRIDCFQTTSEKYDAISKQ